MIGPTMMPAPQMAMAWPCFSLGLMSSSTDCESGTRAAPNVPCRTRNITISVRLVEMPHSMEASVKPPMAIRNRRLRPSRSAAQPVTGVAMAAATM